MIGVEVSMKLTQTVAFKQWLHFWTKPFKRIRQVVALLGNSVKAKAAQKAAAKFAFLWGWLAVHLMTSKLYWRYSDAHRTL
jgi:hypothetical protein